MNNLQRRKFTLTGLRATLLLLLCTFLQTNVFGQANPMVAAYTGQFDLKHYSTTQVPLGVGSGPAMPGVIGAGTYFGTPGAGAGNPNWTHFVNIDNNGNIFAWVYMQETGNNCLDERSVHVVNNPSNNQEYFLTSLVRLDDGNGFIRDCIKIYMTDENGTILNEHIFSSTGYFWENLYPMHSVFHNGSLYVCGYALKSNSIPIGTEGPTYIPNSFSTIDRWEKAAFVMKIDPYATPNMTSSPIQFFDYVPTVMAPGAGTFSDVTLAPHFLMGYGAPNQPGPEADFDMAFRMTVIDDRNNIGNQWLHVTGGVNAMNLSLAGLSQQNTANGCGIMNLTLDLNTLSVVNDKPFKADRDNAAPWTGAMGVGIIQTNGSLMNSGYFIVGNHYTPEIWVSGPDAGGYHPVPHNMFAAYLDGGNLIGSGAPEPLYSDPKPYIDAGIGTAGINTLLCFGNDVDWQGDEWAVNVVECTKFNSTDCQLNASAPTADPKATFWVGGYKGAYASNNYDVTMTKLDLGFDINNVRPASAPALSEGIYSNTLLTPLAVAHTTTTGTGPVLNPSNFFTLGYGLSNMLYAPAFFSLYDLLPNTPGGEELVALGPKWNLGNQNMRMVRARLLNGNIETGGGTPTCSGSYSNFSLDTIGYKVIQPHGIDIDVIMTNTPQSATDFTPITMVGTATPTIDICNTNGGNYKGTGITIIKDAAKTVIYPNPAGTEVYIEPAKGMNMNDDVQVVLLNMYGKVCGRLYHGKLEGLGGKHAIQLPDVANGVYMIQMYGGEKMLLNEKLNIVK